ncbi:MFS transporter [Desertibaculum subflavum]|uniref:MFS transporter n=1 Tax=Desertibaculum subflavum TaxID=2268458 RepID=UPI000E66752B
MIRPRTVLILGLSQLVCWGITYYLIGAFGHLIAADLGWSMAVVHGGFSAGLAVMGVVSARVGRLIETHGGRNVMVAGSLLTMLGCVGLALARDLWLYYAAWAVLGLAMRMTLYDAAFAALARIGGPEARRPIAQITLLGGLASTVLWPVGHGLAELFGWRGAVLCYAGFAALTVPLHLAVPRGRYQAEAKPADAAAPSPRKARDRRLAAGLYALAVALATFLNSGMSAHMIAVLGGLGVAASVAVWIGALRGIGQSASRLGEVLFGTRVSPFALNIGASAALPVCFIVGLLSGQLVVAAMFFAIVYGAGNGLLTIVRGTLPLALFDPQVYGSLVGRLLAPSFYLSALAPLAYALVIEHLGNAAALWLSASIGVVILASAVLLRRLR